MRSFANAISFFTLPLIVGAILATAISPSQVSAYSPKEGNVLGTVGFILHRTNFETSHTGARAPWSGGLALVANGDLNDVGQLEVGLFHINKQYFRDLAYRYVGEVTETLHITMGYRYWFTPKFSTALAFSSAYSMGDVRELHNDFKPDLAIDTSARDNVEYGFDLSLQAELFNWSRYAVTFDGLYSLSITGKPNEKADHYGFMIGLRYFIQEKQVVEKPKTAI